MSTGKSQFRRESAVEQLQSMAAPIFAATLQNSGANRLTVHVSAVAGRKTVTAAIKSALGDETRVRFHTPANLTSPRSLEQLVRRFAGDEIVYDPTQAIVRAKALIEGSVSVRKSLGGKVEGLFYAPRQRTLYVALNSRKLTIGDKLKVGELAEIERNIINSLSAAFAARMAECPAVRVGFGIPRTELVPVDALSVGGTGAGFMQGLKRYWKPAAIAALLGFGAAGSAAAQDPAVSAPNLKVIGETGVTSTSTSGANQSTWVLGGSLTLPVGENWGVQIEGGAANIGGDSVYGTAGHVFTRNPDSYLLGLFAAYANEDSFGLEATRVGAEAEVYLHQISVLAKAGYQFSSTVPEGFVGDIELKWYVTDNFAVSAGGGIADQSGVGHGNVEWQPGFSALPGLAFRDDGTIGEDDFHSILGGITYYFGTNASLKDRQRRQDPEMELIRLFKHVEQQREKLCAQYGCP